MTIALPHPSLNLSNPSLDKHRNQLIGEEGIARRLLMDQLYQSGYAFRVCSEEHPQSIDRGIPGRERRKG